MKRTDHYVDLEGKPIPLADLDAEERRLVAHLRRRAHIDPDWDAFDNYWTKTVASLYAARGRSWTQARQTVVYQIAQDLSSRLAVRAGLARLPDYRDELEELISAHFPSRRAFCKATGLSEDMLSHVLAGRKDLSLAKLTSALERVGYALHIAPARQRKQTG
jgi:hypothetical protein